MKLSDCLNYINQALNYPSLTFNDISLYFNSAIAELNTTLHTEIPTVSDMITEFRQKSSKVPTIVITIDPQASPVIPTSTTYLSGVYYNPTNKLFYYQNTSSKVLNGVYFREGHKEVYKAIAFGNNAAWQITDSDNVLDCDLGWYFPDEWVLLWLIPYVCFKYTVRDGGTASSFAEELTQGFQQLQETYNVPESVILSTVADKEAYSYLVEKALPNLDIRVRTLAIYTSMKHDRALNAVFGSMYDRGGF